MRYKDHHKKKHPVAVIIDDLDDQADNEFEFEDVSRSEATPVSRDKKETDFSNSSEVHQKQPSF